MTDMIPFTRNYQDRSTEVGFQFEFFCERCGNGYASSFQPSASGIGGNIAQTASSLFGGFLGNLGNNAADLVRGPARDAALKKAVEEMRPHFMQCPRCGTWVCKEVCWNNETGLCAQCSPKLTQEITAMKSQAQIQQVQQKVEATNLTAGIDVTAPTIGTCPHCGAASQGGKFCAECGQLMIDHTKCVKCGAELKSGAKFCSECGQSAGS